VTIVTVARDFRHAKISADIFDLLGNARCPAGAHPTVTEITARLPSASYTRF
jgi:hypothetical protein